MGGVVGPDASGLSRHPPDCGANLFFPEEMPDVIAEEAKLLWGISRG
jgi:hypothetical protein